MKMEQTEFSETSAYKLQTPGYYQKENIKHTEHGESLKSRTHSIFRLISSLFLYLLSNLWSDVLIDKCEVLGTFGLVCRGPRFCPNSRSHFEILGARKVTWRKFQGECPKFWSDL
jgi:hypothetical protein